MSFIRTKALSEITAEDINRLVGVPEDIDVEFKREYHKTQYGELRRDVTSFANAEGGDIYVGVDEEEGVASNIPGLPEGEKEAQRLEQAAYCHVWPRIPGLRTQHIDMKNGTFVVIIRIPKGLSGPHAYVDPSKEVPEFLKRYSQNQKRPMTVEEIRQAVLENERVHDRVEEHLEHLRDKMHEKYSTGRPVLYVYSSLVPPREDAFASEGKCLQELASDYSQQELFCNPPGQKLNCWGIEWAGPTRIDAGAERYPEITLRGCTIGKFDEDGMVQEWHSSGYGCSLCVCPLQQERESDANYSIKLADMIAGHAHNFLDAYCVIARRFGVVGPFVGGLVLRNAKINKLKLPRRKDALRPQVGCASEDPIEVEPLRFLVDDAPGKEAGKLCDKVWHAFGHPRCPWFENGEIKPYEGLWLAQ